MTSRGTAPSDSGHSSDPAGHPAAKPMFAAWQKADPGQRRDELGGLRPPGLVALRGRYLHLLDPEAPAGPWDAGWTLADWLTALQLETEGDEAVRRNEGDRARAAFTAVARLASPGDHPVSAVHAHLGLGDIAWADEDIEAAVREYEAGLALARAAGYRFGQLRALIGLGYVTLTAHSAGEAALLLGRAAELARAIGDPLYASNAALGLAECQERLGYLDQAAEQAAEAYRQADAIQSAIGRGNAAQRLGAMLHRLDRRAEAAEWLERAHAAFTEARNPMGLTNALSGLGDLRLHDDDTDGAEQAYAESLRVAEAAGLPRSRAHALQDLARVELVRGDWAAAARGFTVALAAYREIDDVLGVSNALDKLARCRTRLGQASEAVQTRLEAVFAIEKYRATHRDERSQREYRNRFARVYAAALEAADGYRSAESFAVVADCLAGRRLAGLFAAEAMAIAQPGPLALLHELLARADQRLVERHRNGTTDEPETATGPPRRERVIRMLGAVGVRHGLAPRAEASLEDLLATVYLPPQDEGAALLAALPSGAHTLQVLLDPEDAGLLRWLWRRPGSPPELGTTALTAACSGLITVLNEDGDDRSALRLADLAPLSELLPEGLRAELSGDDEHRLLLIPAGELWLVPWSAVPVCGGRVLGEVASYAICPSLTVQRQLAERGEPAQERLPRQAGLWRSPLVTKHGLAAFRQDPAWQVTVLADAAQARHRMRSGDGTMVVTGHGRPAPGLGHYLELDQGEWLLPADMIGARPPQRLAVIACWGGAIPGRGPTDPVSLGTLALAAGSAEILATVGELADSAPAEGYVERVLAGMASRSLPAALQDATRWVLADAGMRAELVHHWAPLVPIGTLY